MRPVGGTSTVFCEEESVKLLIKSAWGSDDPTKAAFPFLHANAFAEAGHEVQIFLLGEGVSLMRTPVANAVVPVGWPPLAEILAQDTPTRCRSTSERVLPGPWVLDPDPAEERHVAVPLTLVAPEWRADKILSE
jgi:hypothetical protein